VTPEAISPVPLEARPYQGRRAGLVTRMVTTLVDSAVVLLVLLSCYVGWNALLFLVSPRTFQVTEIALVRVIAVGTAVAVVYLTACWAVGGRTYGAHVMGVRVVTGEGAPPGPVTAFVRAVVCVVFPAGLLWCAAGTGRAVHDVLLGTAVVYDWSVHPARHDASPASAGGGEGA
jgi:uncharacterized RDD family membrane protein YckC